MWVNIYGDDMDFITSWVIVITYINSVGLLLFSTFGPHLGSFLFGGALASGISVTNFTTWPACGVLGRAGGSARCMGFCAIPSCILVLEGFDSINSFGSKAHSTEVVYYGYESPACFEHLGCCGLEVNGE